ncbi:MAG: MBL fold metallo-hydrolase [Abditibacteriales bacterium]|nr:MBL fold metallo-hydrolase [Abditibacteriales bacterium]MDW8367071.1 MBL fold metallo-hydrolase [Abditibacteriales bacterium]
MMRWQRVVLLILLVGLCGLCPHGLQAAQQKGLDIYFIDVEGGAATLIVTPQRESLLVDCGWPGERDPARIAKVAKEVAGLKQIDHLIITHWHTDHAGDVAQLMKVIPVKNFYDRGIPDPLPRDVSRQQIEIYRQATQGKSIPLKPGDEIKLKSGSVPLKLRVLASSGIVLGEPPHAPQTRPCDRGHAAMPEDTSDNARSIAFLLSFGNFDFFDAGDLTWNVEHKLVCPTNLVGTVDVYQVTHHGMDISNNPVLMQALQPRVAIMNNGPRKGGAAKTYARLKSVQGLEDIFQLHRNVQTTEEDNAPPAFVANDEENCQGEFIHLSVDPTGQTYTVAVPSKGTRRSYQTR